MPIGTLVFVAVFGAGAAWLLGYGFWSLWFGASSPEWPAASGEIVTSDLQKSRDRDGTTYRAEVVYKYTVADKEYVADRVCFGDGMYTSFATKAVRETERYRPGNAVQVRYDPANPQRAVLEPGTPALVWFVIAMGVVCAGVAVVVAFGVIPVRT